MNSSFRPFRAIFVCMNPLVEKIKALATKVAEHHGLCLIDIVVRGTAGKPVFQVFIDGEKNVTADDCSKVSLELQRFINSESLFEDYRLDVSSPGVDRPLKYLWQFPKHLNRDFEVVFKDGDSSRTIKGKLTGIEDDYLTFSDDSEMKLKFNDIIKAKVLVSFKRRR